MKSRIVAIGSFLAGISLALSAALIAGPVTLPNSFTANTPARAAEVNANFTALKTAVDGNDTRISAVEATVPRLAAVETTVNRLTGIEATVNGGNVVLALSTSTSGNIFKGPDRFLHDFGSNNVFLGVDAGNFTMTGDGGNTAVGTSALRNNTTGINNDASGVFSLFSNTVGQGNTAHGAQALAKNTTGDNNTASGFLALKNNTEGVNNTAIGVGALKANTIGVNNIAIGVNALLNLVENDNNIAIGVNAGSTVIDGHNNILIGNQGVPGDIQAIRIGNGVHVRTFIAGVRGGSVVAQPVPVFVDTDGKIGVIPSSLRFKDHVADMEGASTVLSQLRPVTFYYKSDKGPQRALQYGLIAEEVAKVAPELVAYDAQGEIQTVYYQFLAPMLLNEYQKQQRTIEAQAAEIADLREQAARTTALLSKLERVVNTYTAAR